MASLRAAESDPFLGAWYTSRDYAKLYGADIFLQLEILNGGKMVLTGYLIEKDGQHEVARTFRKIIGSYKMDGNVVCGIFEGDPEYPMKIRLTKVNKDTLLSEESLGGVAMQVKYVSGSDAPWSKIEKK